MSPEEKQRREVIATKFIVLTGDIASLTRDSDVPAAVEIACRHLRDKARELHDDVSRLLMLIDDDRLLEHLEAE